MTYKLEVVVTYPHTSQEINEWSSVPISGIEAWVLALAGYWDTGGHAAIRLTDATGNQQVFGMYPTTQGLSTVIFGDTVVVDGQDADLFSGAEQLIAQDPEKAKSWVALDQREITAAQFEAITQFIQIFKDTVVGSVPIYDAMEEDGINCAGFVKRCLAYAGIPFVESPGTNAYTQSAVYWGPATLSALFSLPNPILHTYGNGTEGGNCLVGGTGADYLNGAGGQDVIFGGVSSDTLDGGAGADFLYGGADNDWLGYTATGLGNESQEEINSDGNFYEGGTGNDVACGSKNKDTYRFARGDGRDYVITDRKSVV